MAYNRRYWRRYYRRYYRGKYSNSYYKTRMSRNFKASANNMTQGGTFNVSVIREGEIPITNGRKDGVVTNFDIAGWISGSDMHRYLSNVFDQYRVEKVSIKVRYLGTDAATVALTNPALLFSCVDRSGFAQTVTLSTLRTYGSYKETQLSGASDISPVHYINIGQSNLVEFTTYSDSKSKVSFPSVAIGAAFAGTNSSGSTLNLQISIEVDAQIRYRGVRLDTSAVSTSV